ncbi:hypothetical protein [Streptomyces sp. NPDC050535]|uniref:hypothetical protein n=1 Tax=Streptomyces sp. NPDC050535 TaxID=3365626 RepID=UPI0037B880BF
MIPFFGHDQWVTQTFRAGTVITMAVKQVEDGIRLLELPWQGTDVQSGCDPELVEALNCRRSAAGQVARFTGYDPEVEHAHLDSLCRRVLTVPRSPRWREAVSTALMGDWDSSLWQTGHLPSTAIGALRAEARTLHRQLVPLWRRRTRHGRVLSLDADLGGMSLLDLVAADIDLLTHTTGGAYEDERLNRVLRALDPAEQQVVFALAEGEGTTWTEAAAVAGAADPGAFGERVRRKTRRLVAEQRRRAGQRDTRSDFQDLCR